VIAGTPDGGEEVLERTGNAEDRAKLYRWERCAEATLAAYRAVLADHR
jgi:glycosyltransferase involved in cell wall biosynthesis